MSDKLSKKLDVTDFKQGDVSFKVKSLDGQHPLIPVGSERMKTEYPVSYTHLWTAQSSSFKK